MHVLPEQKTELYAVAISPDGTRCATAGKERIVRVHEIGSMVAKESE